MPEFTQVLPWLLFIIALSWGLRLSNKLEACRRERNRYYQQRNGLAGELLRSVFPESRRKWNSKYPPAPQGFAPEYAEEVSDFTTSELWFALRIQLRYLDGDNLIVKDGEDNPKAIRIPQELCLF